MNVSLTRQSRKAYRDMDEQELTELIREKTATNRQWAVKALLTLYDLQTEEERLNPLTVHVSNGKGFSPVDQEFLSSLASQARRGYELSDKQMEWVHRLIPKYSKQLARITKSYDLKTGKTMELKTSEIMWTTDNKMSSGVTYTKSINIDPSDETNFPDTIVVKSPSGLITIQFNLDPDGFKYDKDQEVLQAVKYTGKRYGHPIHLMIIPGEEPEPDWSQFPDEAQMIYRKGNSLV